MRTLPAFLGFIFSSALGQQNPAGPLPARHSRDASALYRAITREVDQGVREDTVRLAVVGDLMCHSTQFQSAKTSNGFDFRPAFQAVKPYLSAADLTIGNLETVTAGASETFTGYPMFNTPVEYLDALSDAGFDVLTTANNHSLDRRFPGVERTIEALEARGLLHTGTFRTTEERERPLIVTVKGLRLGILAYTYGTNGIPIPQGKPFAVNLMDTLLMAGDIRKARAEGAEAIAVFLHWGLEYERLPNSNQKAVAEFLARQDVALVMGSHPHVLQPAGWIGAPGTGSFVIYSLGNFFSGQRRAYTDAGIILHLSLIRDRTTGKVRTGDIRFVPTYVSTLQGYRILPVADALRQAETMEASARAAMATDLIRMRAVWSETCSHLSDSTAGILPYR